MTADAANTPEQPSPSLSSSSVPSNANAGCVGPSSEKAGKSSACEGCPNQSACASGAFNSPQALQKEEQERLALERSLENVSHVVLVLSGKGGVGKSTLATQISLTLASRGYMVGLLDVDLCGPSTPRMVGLSPQSTKVHQNGAGGMTPVYVSENLAVMSISFLLQDPSKAVVWRGPRKHGLIQQFLTQVDWEGSAGGLDYLIVDTPPGTSDEHLSTVQSLQKRSSGVSGAVMVTTPEEISLEDVRKELNFCQKTKVPVLGLVENMASYQSPMSELRFLSKEDGTNVTAEIREKLQRLCPEVLDLMVSSDVFPVLGSGPQGMAQDYEVPYWGKLALDSELLRCCEQGICFVDSNPKNLAARAMNGFVDKLVEALPVEEVDMTDDNDEMVTTSEP